jgi:hypothetical protein
VLFPALTAFEAVRKYIFRTVSQITLNYRGGPLSRGVAGSVHGGDRLPWVRVDGTDNFGSLAAMAWHVHVYGSSNPELTEWCASRVVPLHVMAWEPEHERAGLARGALYLLRPDTYVALADGSASPSALDRYFSDNGIRCGPTMTERSPVV